MKPLDKFQKELAQKLQSARQSLNFTIQDVSSRVGFDSYQILSKIEKGERPVRAHELAKFAKIYCKDLNYFLVEEEDFVEPVVIWRDKTDSLQVKELESKFIQYCTNYYNLEQKTSSTISNFFDEPTIDASNFSFPQAEDLAFEYWKNHQLGSRPAFILRKILEEKLSIKILYLDLNKCGSGASAKGKFGSAVLLNTCNAPWRRNYDLAHEFFHLVTWEKLSVEKAHAQDGSKNKTEKLADCFASSLLLPEEIVKSEFDRRLKNNAIAFLDIIDMAREFGVSTIALIYRLVNLLCIDRKEAKKILSEGIIERLDKKKRINDWENEPPYLSDKYIYLAFKCYQKSLISKAKLAEYLGVDLGDVSRFLARYGYSAEEDFDLALSTSRC